MLSTNIKIIDLALKYQYDSPISFSNAFKKMHGISPQNLRKNKLTLKAFPKVEFKPTIETMEELEYRIINFEKQKFYGITTGVIKKDDSNAIKNLFDKSKKDKILDFIIDNSDGKELYYGLSADIYNDGEITNKMQYYILGKKLTKIL